MLCFWFQTDGPARKVRKSLVLDPWEKDSLNVQLFQEQLNNAQVSHSEDTGSKSCWLVWMLQLKLSGKALFSIFSTDMSWKKCYYFIRCLIDIKLQVPDESLLSSSSLISPIPKQEENSRPLNCVHRFVSPRVKKHPTSHKATKHANTQVHQELRYISVSNHRPAILHWIY